MRVDVAILGEREGEAPAEPTLPESVRSVFRTGSIVDGSAEASPSCRAVADVAVLGGGFSGSLLAAALARRGFRVALLEKGRHPRFALGESSTPLSNLLLQELARDYGLPWLAPLAKHGPWKRAYPRLECGLKRGFTFACHLPGAAWSPAGNELLVASSPDDEAGDTHWLRADFDEFVFRMAEKEGVHCFEGWEGMRIERGPPWRFVGAGTEVAARFAVDATGPAAALARAAGVEATGRMRTDSWSVFAHLEGVGRWEEVQRARGADLAGHPYRCDDAALHHVFDDGWAYVLRFGSGLVSAGLLVDGGKRRPARAAEEEWRAMLARFPAVAQQFKDARPIRPWARTGRLQRRMARVAGPDWALLAPSAYTLDALYSTGNAHALWTVRRLARLLERGEATVGYAAALERETDFLDLLVHGSYRALGRPRRLFAWTMLYFAGAIAAEERARQGRAGPEEEFLSSHIPEYRATVERLHEAITGPMGDEEFEEAVRRGIEPWNTAGLADPAKRGLYPW